MSSGRVAAIGLASWDRFLVTDHYPQPGSYAIVRETLEQAGGTTTNTVAALARMDFDVTLAAMIGDDEYGLSLRNELEAEGCDVRYVRVRSDEPTDASTIVVSGIGDHVDRTIYWHQGARLRRGDFVPVEDLFERGLVILDVDDPGLRSFLVDLPSHVSPRTRMLGPLTYLNELPPAKALDLALRHDYVVGNERELCYITGQSTLDTAIARIRDEMILSQTRFLAISRGASGCVMIDRESVETVRAFRVDVVDTTGAGDAFAAGIAVGIVEHRSLADIGRLGNAVGGLATRALGARTSLPSRSEVEQLMSEGTRIEVSS